MTTERKKEKEGGKKKMRERDRQTEIHREKSRETGVSEWITCFLFLNSVSVF